MIAVMRAGFPAVVRGIRARRGQRRAAGQAYLEKKQRRQEKARNAAQGGKRAEVARTGQHGNVLIANAPPRQRADPATGARARRLDAAATPGKRPGLRSRQTTMTRLTGTTAA